MVKSKLNSNVNYSEIKILNEEDRHKEVALFEIELFDIPLLIAWVKRNTNLLLKILYISLCILLKMEWLENR